MTPIADMVERMLLDGVSHTAIVLAVRTVEASVARNVTQNVARDGQSMTPGAIRSRRWRQNTSKNGQLAEANDAAQNPVPERHAQRVDVTARCDLLPSSISKGTTKTGSKQEVVARARGTRITEDFQPDDDAREFARGLGLDPAALRDEFVDFWIAVPGSRGLKLDWQKTYKNRAREVAGRSRGRVNGAAPRPGSKDDTRERTVNALRSLDPFLDRNDAGSSESAGPPIPRQLSFVKPA